MLLQDEHSLAIATVIMMMMTDQVSVGVEHHPLTLHMTRCNDMRLLQHQYLKQASGWGLRRVQQGFWLDRRSLAGETKEQINKIWTELHLERQLHREELEPLIGTEMKAVPSVLLIEHPQGKSRSV